MTNTNKALSKAGKAKKDEFYTQLSDIENELRHYKKHFKGKVVFCNCDDPYESNFFKYFAINFNHLGLKKLICTCYAGSPVIYTQPLLFGDEDKEIARAEAERKPYKIEITHVDDLNGDGAVDLTDIELLLRSVDGKPELLQGDGDFRSEECVELLKQADIVVTNPPFSLFREYVAQLMQYQKKFIIIGNQNAIHYKEIFPLIRDNKIWLGNTYPKEFITPIDLADRNNIKYKDGSIIATFGNINWFTNLDFPKRHEELVLYKNYTKEEYPTYENFDAIEVNDVARIPCDYYGMMGITDGFVKNYNPEQFEIIGLGSGRLGQSIGVGAIAPEHKQQMTSHAAAGDLYYLLPDGTPKIPYSRIIIRRKKK